MMQAVSEMDPPSTEVEHFPGKIDDGKDEGPSFHCDLCDAEVVYKIAQELLPGLSTACVDSTRGDIFRTPASVAIDMRKEMVEYLTQRSETFVAESVILEGGADGEVSDHPFDIVSSFIEDFAVSKRNFFSRVSGWLLSEGREDRIDDVIQEMEMNGFWPVDRRESIAQTLLKNVDFKFTYHCRMKFDSAEELAEHVCRCSFRTLNCMNDGCAALFTAGHLEDHDSVCPFKIIPCEQSCSATIMRREMDRHCITDCPMKLVNCPFLAVGCQTPVPQCKIEQHCSDNLHSHLVYILKGLHKEPSENDLEQRAEQLEKMAYPGQLSARNVRFLTVAVKDLDAKLGPLEIKTLDKSGGENTEVTDVTLDSEQREENTETTRIAEESQQPGG